VTKALVAASITCRGMDNQETETSHISTFHNRVCYYYTKYMNNKKIKLHY